MKKLIIALALTATAAHAEGIDLNKDCSKPLSKYGVDILESQPVYKAYRQTFDRAFSRFCEDGKKLQDEMGFEAANARASIEAARWMRKEFADDLEPNQRGMFESLLAAAGMGGYTGFDLPRDPTPPRSAAAAEKIAAANKAAAAKAAAAVKAAADKAAANDVDDLFGDLRSGKNAPRKAQATQAAARGVDISGYATQIRNAIEAKIPRPEQYAGKRCLLQMNLARDGMVISIRSEGGDPALCQAAISAVKEAKIPPAPNDEVYQVVQNARLDFQL
ncbi:cell envelope integrity protein TolA [Leclercia tamurae]|uniref:cell envelope integrity protein TolA n=1 Tax=Leclercia tamurae TaxID=2926467 RepID=UPI0036F462FF